MTDHITNPEAIRTAWDDDAEAMMPADTDPDHVCTSLPCVVCGRQP